MSSGPVVSIGLPSIYEEACGRALRNIRNATRCSFQVVLVSPFPSPVEMSEVVWIEEKVGTGSGCTAAHAAAYEQMTGEFVLPWTDDHILVDCWDTEALANYHRREEAFHAVSPEKPFVLGLRHLWPDHVGTEFGIFYPYFPFVRRSYLKDLGGWFDPAYRRGFADSDFAMRVWSASGRCEWSEKAAVYAHKDDGRKTGVQYAQSDMDEFVKRWRPQYGRGWDVGHLRGFNVDYPLDRIRDLIEGNSLYCNDPAVFATRCP